MIYIVAPMAPHGQFILNPDGSIETSPAVPADRHKDLFKDVKSKFHPA